ncbi:hypothetical protein OG911_45280 [Streptomyces sp. NBC_00208]|uniref:hypothetical protein n=1 Tax=Streptomyces sp. NBC_00208 TaxID=2975681 RepID=UPI002E2D1754|nr:hypothetical protein [Streptomyces sp. NBC_00208]
MTTTTAWYVLVEEDTRESKPVDGQSLKFHRWKLTASQHVEGGEEAAARSLSTASHSNSTAGS